MFISANNKDKEIEKEIKGIIKGNIVKGDGKRYRNKIEDKRIKNKNR